MSRDVLPGRLDPMDVIVVGGGIVGTSAAFHLAGKGVSTALVDAAHAGQATAAGTGIVFPWPFPWDDPREQEFKLRAAEHYPRLMAELAYGAGLRLMELLRLRIHHLDLDRQRLQVFAGKGDKDRVTVLPEKLIP